MIIWRDVYIYSAWVFSVFVLVSSVLEWFLPSSIKWRILWALYCFVWFLEIAVSEPWVGLQSWPGDQSCAIVIGLASIIYFLSVLKDWPERQEKVLDKRSIALVEKQKKRVLIIFWIRLGGKGNE